MDYNDPYFSVIIPCYNRAHLLLETIASVLLQTFEDYEIWIIDDGSTDDTAAVISTLQDPRIHYHYQQNGERGAARNAGIRLSRGTYVTFLDSDDRFYAQHLEQCAEFLKRNPDIKCFHKNYEYKNAETHEVSRPAAIKKDVRTALLKGNRMSCCGVFLHRETLIQEHLFFSENRALSGSEDWLMWLRWAARFEFGYDRRVSASLIDHSHRSVHQTHIETFLARTQCLISSLEQDDAFTKYYGKNALCQIEGHMLTYLALHLALEGAHPFSVLKYFMKGLWKSHHEVFSKRFLVIWREVLRGC